MAEYPALPLFTDAFLADTLHLNTVQIGAYMLMIMTAWRAQDCALPNDDVFLARICRMDRRTWGHNREVLLSFWHADGARLQQKRLKDERNYVDQKRNINSANGKASALKRLNRGSTTVTTNGQRKSNPHTHTYSSDKGKEPLPLHGELPLSENVQFAEFWERWKPYEMSKGGKPDALKAYNKARKETDHETLIRTSAQYAANCHSLRIKTKHVSSWLNGRGWEQDDATRAIEASGNHGHGGSAINRKPTALDLALADRTHTGNKSIAQRIIERGANPDKL